MPAKRVTIAIPTRNRAEYLRLAIASALAQSYSNVEVLVSDNVSTDRTQEVLAEFCNNSRLRVLRQSAGLNMVENWNACVAAAEGEYFLLLSDDDLLEPEAISELVRRYEEGPLPPERIGIVYCRGRIINENGEVQGLGPRGPEIEDAERLILNYLNGKRSAWACTVLFRHSDVKAGYTPTLPLGCEAAQWIQAVARYGNAVYVDRILASYRRHTSLTAITPIATWREDNSALADYAIEALRASGLGSSRSYDEIRRATDRLTLRMIPFLLKQRYSGQKLAFLKALATYWRDFASLSGLDCMARGLLQSYAPIFVSRVGDMRRRLLGVRD